MCGIGLTQMGIGPTFWPPVNDSAKRRLRIALVVCALTFAGLPMWAVVKNKPTSNGTARTCHKGERLVTDLPATNTDPAKADTTASEACTRSGAFALLLSVVLFLLIPYWLHQGRDIAVRKYRAYRYNLTIFLEMLDDDPSWQKYSGSHEAAESMSIAQLRDLWLETPTGEANLVKDQSRPASVTKKKTQEVAASKLVRQPPKVLEPPKVPAPPTNVTAKAVETLREIPQIVDLLSKLNDAELLTRSREAERYYDFSIVRWANKRNDLVYRNAILQSCTKQELETPHQEPKSEYFVPALQSETLLRCLTLGDLRELAHFELPPSYSPVQDGKGEVEVVPGSLPRDPHLATVLAQALLFFVIVYFGSFAREAVLSTTFPAQGTLFGALSRSFWTLLVFILALWSPVFASIAVSVTSRKWPTVALTVLIFCAVLSVHRVLMQKSYFGPLDPRQLLVHGNRPGKNLTPPDSQSADQGTELLK